MQKYTNKADEKTNVAFFLFEYTPHNECKPMQNTEIETATVKHASDAG